jgi:hypothetical protein
MPRWWDPDPDPGRTRHPVKRWKSLRYGPSHGESVPTAFLGTSAFGTSRENTRTESSNSTPSATN